MITLEPIGFVKNERKEVKDDFWGSVKSKIIILNKYPEECLEGIEGFSHLEIIYYFDKVDKNEIMPGSVHPRNNPDYPKVGIFAMRKKDRPNLLGLTMVKLVRKERRTLFVEGLDAIDGTPVLDIKPVFREFLPSGEVVQPEWVSVMLKDYYAK